MKLLIYEDGYNNGAQRVREIKDDFDVESFLDEECPEGEGSDYVVIEGDFKYTEGSIDKT